MYEYIKGTLIEATPQFAIIDVQGVGYKINIPLNLFQKLPQEQNDVLLFTYFVVRENDQALYGFLTRHERELFCRFIAVSGIGPKTALAMLGHSNHVDIISSIRQNNVSALCKIPGIGKKTAERLILEIKDKLPIDSLPSSNQIIYDAMNALTNLGYSQTIAEKAIKEITKDKEPKDLALLITQALKHC